MHIKNSLLTKRLLTGFLSLTLFSAGLPATVFGAEAAEPVRPEETVSSETLVPGAEETPESDPVISEDKPENPEVTEGALSDTLSENALPVVSDEAPEEAAGDGVVTIEVNQGFSYHTGLNDGKFEPTYLTTLVAKKKTAVMMMIPGSDADGYSEDNAKQAVANYKLEAKAVVNGQESDNCELTADGDSFRVMQAYDNDCDVVRGWYAVAIFPTGPDKGTYNFHIKSGDTEVGKQENVTFYETQNLNILVVPVNGYWSQAFPKKDGAAKTAGAHRCMEGKFFDNDGNEREWKDLCSVLKEYMLDVYPIADVNFEEGQEVQANDASYDMVTSDGQKKLWEEVCKLQSKTKEGKDRYDLILAFVQYRQDSGAGQGYTFGKPTNVITYCDKDMLPTVAHEIAHCYQVGDEYNGGSFNTGVNFPPNGYDGRNFVTGEDIKGTSGASSVWKDSKQYKNSEPSNDKKSKVDDNGAGTLVPLGLRPFSLSKDKFITWAGVDASGNPTGDMVSPTLSWMGSGYSGSYGFYFTSSVIWDHLLKQLIVKEKKDNSQEQQQESEQSNAQVFENAVKSGVETDEYSIFTDEDDFYYDDDYRFGESTMVEANGWLKKGDGGQVSVAMNPLFSYDGDLETIDVLDETYKNSKDIYTFAALNDKEEIFISPVDQRPSTVSFNGSFFNPRSGGGVDRNETNFNFDAEYPEGTTDFVIIRGKVGSKGEYNKSDVIWQATKDTFVVKDKDVFKNKPEGYLNYSEVNENEATVEWDIYYPEGSEEPYDNKDKKLYTEVYYCPEGDDGEAYYAGCSNDKNWKEGSISFKTSDFKTKWTRNAYVWIKVTNGINAVDIYSDENDITLCNSTITLTGAGIKSAKENNETTYFAEYTGKPIVPNAVVKARNPETGGYISLKKDVDYSISYKDNTAVGYASVVVQGIGTYAGKNTQEFEIRKRSLEKASPDSIPDVLWDSSWNKDRTGLDAAVQKYLSATDSAGNPLVYDKDFTVKYSVEDKTGKTLSSLVTKEPEKEAPVTVTVIYRGKGNYEGECRAKVSFSIFSSAEGLTLISDENATLELKFTEAQYTGKAVKPAVKKLIVSGNEGPKKLKSSQYRVVYSNNISIGTGRVKILGKNGYIGSISATFKILPKKVTSLSVKGPGNQPYTGREISANDLPIVVKAGNIVLTKDVDYRILSVDGSDYTNVTKKEKPAVKIELIKAEPNTKASLLPKVEWKNEEKTIVKKFSIVKTKFNSAAVTFSTSSNDTSKNKVRDSEGKEIATIRSATKDELNTGKRKYTYVIEGSEDFLPKDADISLGASIKAFGNDLSSADYTVTVSKTRDGKIGSITFKAKKGSPYTGKKTIKFMYVNKSASEE